MEKNKGTTAKSGDVGIGAPAIREHGSAPLGAIAADISRKSSGKQQIIAKIFLSVAAPGEMPHGVIDGSVAHHLPAHVIIPPARTAGPGTPASPQSRAGVRLLQLESRHRTRRFRRRHSGAFS